MKILLAFVLFVIFALSGRASSEIDGRLKPITNEELVRLIRVTPPESQQHWQIIRRAYGSDSSPLAFREYNRLLSQQPNNPYWNLFVGWAALDCFMMKAVNPQTSIDDSQMLQIARRRLARAAQLKPDDPRIMVCYGFYLWQFYNQMAEGLRLMEQAQTKKPDDPFILVTLGQVYSNASGNKYLPRKAEEYWVKASKLDTLYAAPRWWLARFYAEQKRFMEANQEITAYLKLRPEGAKKPFLMDDLITDIQKGLSKTSP